MSSFCRTPTWARWALNALERRSLIERARLDSRLTQVRRGSHRGVGGMKVWLGCHRHARRGEFEEASDLGELGVAWIAKPEPDKRVRSGEPFPGSGEVRGGADLSGPVHPTADEHLVRVSSSPRNQTYSPASTTCVPATALKDRHPDERPFRIVNPLCRRFAWCQRLVLGGPQSPANVTVERGVSGHRCESGRCERGRCLDTRTSSSRYSSFPGPSPAR